MIATTSVDQVNAAVRYLIHRGAMSPEPVWTIDVFVLRRMKLTKNTNEKTPIHRRRVDRTASRSPRKIGKPSQRARRVQPLLRGSHD